MSLDLVLVLFAGLLGLLVGSFSNVLIWRLPRGESVAFPPSHCPNCDHALAPKDLVPLFSWLTLGGRCRYCRAPIKARYPVVEALTGLGYALIALAYPPLTYGAAPLGLMLLFTLLLVGSAIDLDTFQLPDEITLTGVVLGLVFAAIHGGVGSLPSLSEAVSAALMGAGLLVLINLLGTWVMRRFRERQYPEFPLGYQQISLGLLVGAWAGPVWAPVWALGAALVSVAASVGLKRVLRVPELLTLGGFLASLVVVSAGVGRGIVPMLGGALAGAGAAALLCGAYWWVYHRMNRAKGGTADATDSEADATADAPSDAVAMGFGDVKLMAAIGAFLGWENVLVTLVGSLVFGVLTGLVGRASGKGSKLPFGPSLAAGAVVALFWGPQIAAWYRGLLGV